MRDPSRSEKKKKVLGNVGIHQLAIGWARAVMCEREPTQLGCVSSSRPFIRRHSLGCPTSAALRQHLRASGARRRYAAQAGLDVDCSRFKIRHGSAVVHRSPSHRLNLFYTHIKALNHIFFDKASTCRHAPHLRFSASCPLCRVHPLLPKTMRFPPPLQPPGMLCVRRWHAYTSYSLEAFARLHAILGSCNMSLTGLTQENVHWRPQLGDD